MRGAVAVSTSIDGLKILEGKEKLSTYQFNTGTAKHYFCSVCGIYTHHRRRSNPQLYGVNTACLEGVSPFDFEEVAVLDGVNHPRDTGRGANAETFGVLRFSLSKPTSNEDTADAMFDHLSFGVENLERSGAFYDATLAPLGYVRLSQNARSVCYGPEGFTGEAPFAIIALGSDAKPAAPGFHLAFSAPHREAVDRFHAAALRHGGIDEGSAGIRENYAPGYYAAFVRDLDGHRLEAVVHE